jgi:SAM-dependent methyltransferase
MNISKEELLIRLKTKNFPLSSKYDPHLVIENQMGPNVLWLTEWLCQEITLEPGERVLDMGCGKALSSIFLAREFNVRVWAADLWIKPTENWKRICQQDMTNSVFPVYAEAHALPFAEGFFDSIISLDSYHYYGTDDLYLGYILSFLKTGGNIGIVVPGLMREFDGDLPEYLTRRQPSGSVFWNPAECFSFHTVDWWRRHWEQTGLVKIKKADILADGWRLWLKWAEMLDELGTGFDDEAPALRADRGRYLGFIRLVAEKNKR